MASIFGFVLIICILLSGWTFLKNRTSEQNYSVGTTLNYTAYIRFKKRISIELDNEEKKYAESSVKI